MIKLGILNIIMTVVNFQNIYQISKKSFYLAMISVDGEFRGNDYSTQMINYIKNFAKEKGAMFYETK